MRGLELELYGETFRARLLDQQAPRTCAALWDALPLSAQVVHAKWSGNLIRTLEGLPVSVDDLESGWGFQYPGLVALHPASGTLAIVYGDARFRCSVGPAAVTPVAELVGDVEAFARLAARLQWEGATTLALRPVELSGEELAGGERRAGTQIEIELAGRVVTATLLEEEAPRTCAAFRALLPLEGQATNTKWSGDMLHFWGPDRPNRGSIGLRVEPVENPTRFHWPGYIYYYPEWSGIRIPYGDAQMSGAFRTCDMTAFARFNGDWSAFREVASRLHLTGAQPMKIRLKE